MVIEKAGLPRCVRCQRAIPNTTASFQTLRGDKLHCTNLHACVARCEELERRGEKLLKRLTHRADVIAWRKAVAAVEDAKGCVYRINTEIEEERRRKPTKPSRTALRELELLHAASQKKTAEGAAKLVSDPWICGPCGLPFDVCKCDITS